MEKLAVAFQISLEELGSAEKVFESDKNFELIDIANVLVPMLNEIEKKISHVQDQLVHEHTYLTYFMLWILILLHLKSSVSNVHIFPSLRNINKFPMKIYIPNRLLDSGIITCVSLLSQSHPKF